MAHKIIYRKDYQIPSYLIERINIDFNLCENSCVVTARTDFHRHPELSVVSAELFLHGEGLELLDILMDGVPLSDDCYRLSDRGLTLLAPPQTFTLEVKTKIYPDRNTALEGLYRSSGNFCTQCEPEGFRKITYYLDRPDVMASFTTRIEADRESCPVLLANGNCIEKGGLSDNRHFAVWEDPYPKPCYLFALVAGDLVSLEDVFVTRSGRCVALKIFVQERNQARCDHAMESLKKSMRWDEEVFGLEYDLDIYMIVAVDDFNMGAMENKGLNIFNSKYVLASQETATDQDYLGVEGVIAHEYFHNWTGNRVTCRDWFQLSLKEGLTVFRDQEFSADMNSRTVQRIDDVRVLQGFQFREDAGPTAHPVRPDSYVEINNFYTLTVYNKGAELIRMMRTILGQENFLKGVNLYFERFDGQAVTCDDFICAMSDASGVDLEQFKLWYSQAGTPVLEVEEEWKESLGEYSLIISQDCPATPDQAEKAPFHIPVAFGLVGRDGRDIACQTKLLELRKKKERFVFGNLPEKPVVSLLRDFSAPVKIISPRSRQDLAFLAVHDSDLFNRWDSAYRMTESVLQSYIYAIQEGRKPEKEPLLTDIFRYNINNKRGDKALLAMALGLPEESYLAQQVRGPVDPDSIHQARCLLQRELCAACGEELRSCWEANNLKGDYELSPETMGARRLKNVCLKILMGAGVVADEDLERARRQYFASNNMTDRVAVLAALVNCEDPLRQELFDDFYGTWKDEPLVVDKWLMLQAGATLPGTLDNVVMLMGHPAFSSANPNKIRSLIGSFGANHYCFHNRSGAGYKFLADRILEIDARNPQIAARLTTPFGAWRRYADDRRDLMRHQLQRILATEGLSGDVHEMVEKSLGK